MPELPPFAEFAARKTRAAEHSRIAALTTTFHTPGPTLRGIGNAWTRAHYGGQFELFLAPAGQPAHLEDEASSGGGWGARVLPAGGGGPGGG